MAMHAWEAAGMSQEYWLQHSLDVRIRLAAAPYMVGWGYDLTEPAVLWDLPDAMRADKLVRRSHLTNCSTLTTSLLTSVRPDVPWTLQEYGDLQVFGDRLPATDSPLLAMSRMGIGTRADDWRPRRWYLVQGVRRGPEDSRGFSGHAFLVLALKGGGLLVLEATSLGSGGPRYRIATPAELANEYPFALHMGLLHDVS